MGGVDRSRCAPARATRARRARDGARACGVAWGLGWRGGCGCVGCQGPLRARSPCRRPPRGGLPAAARRGGRGTDRASSRAPSRRGMRSPDPVPARRGFRRRCRGRWLAPIPSRPGHILLESLLGAAALGRAGSAARPGSAAAHVGQRLVVRTYVRTYISSPHRAGAAPRRAQQGNGRPAYARMDVPAADADAPHAWRPPAGLRAPI